MNASKKGTSPVTQQQLVTPLLFFWQLHALLSVPQPFGEEKSQNWGRQGSSHGAPRAGWEHVSCKSARISCSGQP